MQSPRPFQSSGEFLVFCLARYSSAVLPLLVFFGYLAGGWATFAGFIIVFGLYGLLEVVLHVGGWGLTTKNPEDEFKFAVPDDHWSAGDTLVLVYAVLQLVAAVAILVTLPSRHFSTHEVVGITLSMGAMLGSVGVLGGHELIHRNVQWKRALGILVFGTFNYAQFRVSHIAGHHVNVGQHADWGTARYRESFYAFWTRAVVMGTIGAWDLEAERLKKDGKSAWSIENFMVKYTLFTAVIFTAIVHFLGWQTLIVFVSWSILGTLLLEMVNYLSHYGLERKLLPDGKLEPLQNRHSWESDNKITNWFIFNAGKHSHHHRKPAYSHEQLTLSHEKDVIPYGFTLMTAIALVPPLYFHIMEGQLENLEGSLSLGDQVQ